MRRFLLAVATVLALAAPALAQEWVVNRVRGTSEIQIGRNWTAVTRGLVVEPQQTLRTGPDGRIGLMRGNETIDLDANTEISLRDAGSELKTSVIQVYGAVSVDVERRNVQHFSVQTPYLAAVVKGTRFTVVVDGSSARVEVDRGVVQVQDTGNDLVTDIRPGQQAVVSENAPLNVTGGRATAVFTFEGVQVVPGTTEPVAAASGSPATGGGPAAAPDPGNPVFGNSGPPAHANAGGNGSGQGNGGNGPPAHANAGGNSGHGNGGNGPPAHSNGGGGPPAHAHGNNGGGNSGHGNGGNGPPAHSNAGGNGGGGPPAHAHGNNGGGNSGHGNGGNGPPAHSNAGGNGQGNGGGPGPSGPGPSERGNGGGNPGGGGVSPNGGGNPGGGGPPEHSNGGGNGGDNGGGHGGGNGRGNGGG